MNDAGLGDLPVGEAGPDAVEQRIRRQPVSTISIGARNAYASSDVCTPRHDRARPRAGRKPRRMSAMQRASASGLLEVDPLNHRQAVQEAPQAIHARAPPRPAAPTPARPESERADTPSHPPWQWRWRCVPPRSMRSSPSSSSISTASAWLAPDCARRRARRFLRALLRQLGTGPVAAQLSQIAHHRAAAEHALGARQWRQARRQSDRR